MYAWANMEHPTRTNDVVGSSNPPGLADLIWTSRNERLVSPGHPPTQKVFPFWYGVREWPASSLEIFEPVVARDLIERLAAHRTLGTAPRTELEWLIAQGSIRHLNPCDVRSCKDQPVEALYVVLSGRLALFVDRGSGPNKAVEWHAGDVTGVLPYSRLVTPPGNVLALEPTELLAIPRGRLRAMTQECCEITSTLVHVMLDRARLFTSSDLQNAKIISLGKLSAGLAHELNNPVAAMERGVGMLEDHLEDTEQAARCLASAALSDSQIAAVDAFLRSCI